MPLSIPRALKSLDKLHGDGGLNRKGENVPLFRIRNVTLLYYIYPFYSKYIYIYIRVKRWNIGTQPHSVNLFRIKIALNTH